jgi:hypothetical protein
MILVAQHQENRGAEQAKIQINEPNPTPLCLIFAKHNIP